MNNTWEIEESCPQCSAPIKLEETDRLLACPFCRVRHYLVAPGPMRYLIPAKKGPQEHLFFIPYQRVRGIVFSCGPLDIRHKVVDTSFPAFSYRFLPPSLGLRPQTMKLKFVSPEQKATLLSPNIEQQEIMARISLFQALVEPILPFGRPPILPKKDNHLANLLIGEAISYIYTPYYFSGHTLYDALVNEPVPGVNQDLENLLGGLATERNDPWRVSFLPVLCPGCGWDLMGDKAGSVLVCPNCETAWEAATDSFRKIPLQVLASDTKEAMYLPFWRMKVALEGLALSSYADLVRFGNLPKAVLPSMEESEISFWSPAFKIQPKLFLRLLHQTTALQPKSSELGSLKGSQFYPVTLSLSEASESIMLTLSSLALGKKRSYSLLQDVRITVHEHCLVCLPFTTKGTELVYGQQGLSIQRNALMMGKKI